MMVKMEHYDVAIMGSGIAGLSLVNYLQELSVEKGRHISVAIIAKGRFDQTNTNWAQGGIAAVTSASDSFQSHIDDTLVAGGNSNNIKIVEQVVNSAPEVIDDLIRWGMDFDKTEKGSFDLVKEGGHQFSRIWHHKDATGAAIQSTLTEKATKLSQVAYFEYNAVTQIEREQSGVFYLKLQHIENQSLRTISADTVVLAGGGIGALYAKTTNQPICTGDSIFFAKELGASLKELCYVQFHPTGLYSDNQTTYLITEAIRGAGAILRNEKGEPFMKLYDERADLAPRDIVSRAIFSEMKKTGAKHVYLDATELGEEKIKTHFPTIYSYCIDNMGLDISKKWIPVVPTQHYLCGGIEVSDSGKTSIEGLYAIGECANTGLHGANRLASNSLLEAVYFAKKAASEIFNSKSSKRDSILVDHEFKELPIKKLSRVALQQKMSENAAIIKRTENMHDMADWIVTELSNSPILAQYTLADIETNHMYYIALWLLQDALEQKQNIGVHFNESL